MNEEELITLAYEFHMHNDLNNAQKYYLLALTLNPQHPQVHNNLGTIYQSEQNYETARFHYEKALTYKPDYLDAIKNKINVLNKLTIVYKLGNELEKAKECALQVIDLDLKNSDAYNNLGVIYKENNDLVKAENCYKKAIELDPTSVDTLLNISLLYLLQKEYEKGFELYKYRYHKYDLYTNAELVKNMSLIQSFEEAEGKKVLISFEQGFGDAIQFIRFSSLLATVNVEFSFYIQKPLKKLFAYNFPYARFVEYKQLKEFHYYFPIMDASHLLGLTYENIPSSGGYLKVDEKDVSDFRVANSLETSIQKIGFAFKGSSLHQNDANRSIELSIFLEGILGLQEDVKLYSLQYGLNENEKKLLKKHSIIDFGSEIKDFYDTVVMTECMDMIITIDSSLVHISGALAKKTFLLLPFAPDWRWGIDDSQTNWYDSVKIYRQQERIQWDTVFDAAIKDIRNEL
ncbi:MAG: tetratricopeptide repeat protein [Thiovulaceae bacterium]|nr:tetratricopeptide repeat protein [Sulfurimonadaceae bacterium]